MKENKKSAKAATRYARNERFYRGTWVVRSEIYEREKNRELQFELELLRAVHAHAMKS